MRVGWRAARRRSVQVVMSFEGFGETEGGGGWRRGGGRRRSHFNII